MNPPPPTQVRRGTALLYILFLTSLVVMFLGALVSANHTAIRMATGLSADKGATSNCQSGLEFAWQQLESDQSFARKPFRHDQVLGDFARLRVVFKNPAGQVDSQYLEGHYLDKSNSGFRVRIANGIHLDGSRPCSFSNQPVLPYSALLRIEGFEGTRTRVLEVALQKAPFISHGLYSGGDITCLWGTNVSQWEVASNDPFRNSIRARGRLDIERLSGGSLKFSPPPGVTPSAFGRYGSALPGLGAFENGQELTAEAYADAARQSRGDIAKRARQDDRVRSLAPEDLKLPTVVRHLPGGVYRFEKASYDFNFVQANGVSQPKRIWVQTFAHYADRNSKEALKMWVPGNYLPPAPNGGRIQLAGQPKAEVVQLGNNGMVSILDANGAEAARINFSQSTFDVPANTMLTFDGSFHLEHRGLSQAEERPRVRLVTQTDPEDENQPLTAAIRAKGDLIIDGGMRGSGTVLADGKLEMYAESTLATSMARPLALYAGQDVHLKRDDVGTWDRTSQATLSEDWTLFKRTIGSNPSLDKFLNQGYKGQRKAVESFLEASVLDADLAASDPDPSYYVSAVTGAFFPEGDPDGLMAKAEDAYTNLRAGGLTLEEAVRFREYCRQLAFDAKANANYFDPVSQTWSPQSGQSVAARWLDPAEVREEVQNLIQSQLLSYAPLVGKEWVKQGSRYRSMREWFNAVGTNPYENDRSRDNSVFRGLVYSRFGNFTLDANYNGLTIIGALAVPQGNVTFNKPSEITTIYDPRYLRDLFVAQPDHLPTRLDQIYWRML